MAVTVTRAGAVTDSWCQHDNRTATAAARGPRPSVLGEVDRSVVMRSPCAGAALIPPLWIVPNKALSLFLSLGRGAQCKVFCSQRPNPHRGDANFERDTIEAVTYSRNFLQQPSIPLRAVPGRHGFQKLDIFLCV